MEYKKERNFIVAYDHNDFMQGKWNILTNDMYGKSGTIVKNIPDAFKILNSCPDNIYAKAIYYIRLWHLAENERANLEKLISVGLLPASDYDLQGRINLNKDIINYCKERTRGRYQKASITKYLLMQQYADKIERWSDVYQYVFENCVSNLPTDYLISVLTRMQNEHVDEFYRRDNSISYRDLTLFVQNYYNISRIFNEEVKVRPNLLSEYAKMLALKRAYTQEHYDDILKRNNDKSFLYFEDENYIAFPIFTKEDFHKEAKAQRNCVENVYMSKVFDNATYIVVVREKINIKKSYITCEVAHTGCIIQYLGFNNRPQTNEKILQFKNEYQKYIYNHIE